MTLPEDFGFHPRYTPCSGSTNMHMFPSSSRNSEIHQRMDGRNHVLDNSRRYTFAYYESNHGMRTRDQFDTFPWGCLLPCEAEHFDRSSDIESLVGETQKVGCHRFMMNKDSVLLKNQKNQLRQFLASM